ncbi:EboA domain-containing protein [Streptomyces sp. NPDC017993]|uniref:EboA domain-containing protein n=1 Tax=Streptomyces sp. NPDC017993 TaxID=3365027 RepID=UPI003793C8DC
MLTTADDWIPRLYTALHTRLHAAARAWLTDSLAEAAHAVTSAHPAADTDHPTGPAPALPVSEPPAGPTPAWETRFAEAGRYCTRREPPHGADPEAAEAARVLILCAAHADVPTVTRLYAHGTAAERRAVLGALPHLGLGPGARPLVEDALRTNDTRLVAAAVGPYAARHLDAHAWRHAILKCLFTGVPVRAVAGLAQRARGDTELARMLGDYARERTAAGRAVPDDLHHVLALTGPARTADRPAPSTEPPRLPAEPPATA